MARALREEQVTPADELRRLLADTEKRVVNLAGSGAGAMLVLRNLDRVAELWPQLEEAGVDLRPEAGRWETVQAQVRRNAGQLVRELRAAGGMEALRASQTGNIQQAWWWHLDREVRERRLKRMKSGSTVLLSVVVIIGAVVFLLNRLFPTDPLVAASAGRQLAGQQKVENRADYESALADFQEAVSLTPDDAEAWLWLGVTYERLGDDVEAGRAFGQATTLLDDEAGLRLGRAPVYFSFGMWTEAEEDLNLALTLDPENPRTHYFLATLYEVEERYTEAIAALERASALAEAHGQTELVAITRYRMGMMIQQMQGRSLQQAPPTPLP
jgi:cytochrome c-type biogenesis protein CcmH/NrfG